MPTAAAIRDRLTALITAATPRHDTRAPFRAYRNEGDGDFATWAELNKAAAYRRFQVRGDGNEDPPAVSNTLVYQAGVTFEIRIAYPHSQRYGADGALDRDDVIDEDCGKLEALLGIHGRANFSGAYDCTPLGNEGSPMSTFERGTGVDFLVMTARFLYQRTVGS